MCIIIWTYYYIMSKLQPNNRGVAKNVNNVEGWHLAFSNIVSRHLHMLKLIDEIKLEQSHTEKSYTQLSTGLVRKRSTRWENYEERVVNLLGDYKKDKMA